MKKITLSFEVAEDTDADNFLEQMTKNVYEGTDFETEIADIELVQDGKPYEIEDTRPDTPAEPADLGEDAPHPDA